MTGYLRDRTVLVTGAGSGFGRLIAERVAAGGGRAVCADIDGDAARATADAIGGAAAAIAADVTRIEDMHAAVALAVDRFGGLDVLVNNAGIMPLAFLADHEAALERWHRCIDINFKGVVNGCVAAHDAMIRQGRGHIVNISSTYGNHPVEGSAVYGATKAAVNYFSESIRQESRGRIKVTLVKPTGVMATGLSGSIVNLKAAGGILAQHGARHYEFLGRWQAGKASPGELDPQDIAYVSLDPEHVADAVLYAIDQPWGVVISDLTVRSSGEPFVL